jgi:hypothetical protein
MNLEHVAHAIPDLLRGIDPRRTIIMTRDLLPMARATAFGSVALIIVLLAAGCANGGTAPSVPSAASRSTDVRLAAENRHLVNPSPAPQSLCIGGAKYKTTQDDEFDNDVMLNAESSDFIMSTPAPNGAIWATKALGFANGGTRNNIGIDDAFYTNSTIAPGYNPFTIGKGSLGITAEPIPKPYATSTAWAGAHWFSGVLAGPAQTYGYIEVSARVPNLQGFWPAPLWLLGLAGDDGKGDGYEELDAAEIFGNVLGANVVQQTQVFNQNDNPPHNLVRWYVEPNPQSTYHKYGVLWTPSTVSYYIDRVPMSPAYPNAANGPANPLIILQVYAASYGGAQPPANKTPRTMNLDYYRWYQATGAGCSPTAIATPPATYPSPTPLPQQTPLPGAPAIVQKTGVLDYPNAAPYNAVFANAPPKGDVLLAILVAGVAVTPPAGWVQISGLSNSPGFQMYAGAVGLNGLNSSATYSFGINSGIIEALDVSGASTSNPGIAGSDPPYQVLTAVTRSLTVPKSGGMLLSIWAGYSNATAGFAAITEQLPPARFEQPVTYRLNNPFSNGLVSLRVSQAIGDPFDVSQPYTVVGTSAVFGDWAFDGDLVWFSPRN